MSKALKLAVREYKAAVRTRGFVIGLILMPVLMGGSALTMALMKDKVDTRDRRLAVVDYSGRLADHLLRVATEHNAQIHDQESGKRIRPAYLLEIVPPDREDPQGQRLALSQRVRRKDLHAFVEIGAEVLHPGQEAVRNSIRYYGRNAAMDETRQWLRWPINNQLRQLRLADAGIDAEAIPDLFRWIDVEGLGLVTLDEATGTVKEARRSSELEVILGPYVLVLLMFMMFMMGAMPLLSSVSEEKTLRIAEVLLGSMRPTDFMMGKVLGGVGVALTSALVYVIGGVLGVRYLGLGESIPYHALPWFFAYLILAMFMLGAGFTALGSTCSDAKDAQSMTLPGMLPILIPMFVFMPVILNPESTFATVLSLIPPFTPMVMVARVATQAGIPTWQPAIGLIGVVLWTWLTIWAGGRIFRIGILSQGKRPRLAELARWVIQG